MTVIHEMSSRPAGNEKEAGHVGLESGWMTLSAGVRLDYKS